MESKNGMFCPRLRRWESGYECSKAKFEMREVEETR